jgi:hypothetical protein
VPGFTVGSVYEPPHQLGTRNGRRALAVGIVSKPVSVANPKEGLRIGEALAARTRCRINKGTALRVREQVNLYKLSRITR